MDDEGLGQKAPLLIDVRHAIVSRGAQPVLRDLSLEIPQGCSTVILGPNGCGKSTLLKVFSRELYPVLGPDRHVRLMGKEAWNVWDFRTQLGIVSVDMQQGFSVWTPGMEIILSGFFFLVWIFMTIRLLIFISVPEVPR